jgi:tRNA U34 5-carboxymethylaminomethyl modifying enzyme MnmG/GidA
MPRFSGVECDYDVVVVGAGVAGCTSAHAIITQQCRAQGETVDVLVQCMCWLSALKLSACTHAVSR